MRTAIYQQRGPIPQDVIACVEEPTPAPGAGEVLLELLAAPINPSDVLTLTGQYGILPPLPAIGGNEGVARVAAVGDGVTEVSVGDIALMPVGRGTWTSHVVTPAASLMRLPAGGDAQQLAMLAVNPPTASLLLSEFVVLPAGAWVIQNAANSAVGEYLVQLAHARGLRTVNVVRREEAIAPLQALGADVVLLDGPDLARRVAVATNSASIMLGLDAVAGSATDRLAQCVAVGGTVVNYGAMSGEACKVAPGTFVFRNITLRGFWLVTWFRTSTAAQQQALYTDLAQRIARGELSARIQATYPLSRIKEAVAAAAAGGRAGKILLVPG